MYQKLYRHHMRILLTTLITLGMLTIISLVSITSVKAQSTEFNRKTLLESLTQTIILPYHQAFLAQTKSFLEHIQAFVDNPNKANLQAAQDSWKATSLAWAHSEYFEMGTLYLELIHNQIYKSPYNPKQIEGFIAGNEALNSDFIEGIGATAKGLAALEYLLFSAEGNDAVLRTFQNPRRLEYLSALAVNLQAKAQELLDYWQTEYAAKFTDNAAKGESTKNAINMTMNSMMAFLETIIRAKLGTPLGQSSGGPPQPDKTEAPLSQISLERIRNNLESIHDTFTLRNAKGFDSYLESLGNKTLADKVHSQFETIFADLDAISLPLEEAVIQQTDAVSKLKDDIKILVVSLSADVANQLGITVTFNDSDGD